MANSGNTSSPEQNDKLSPLTPTATTMDRQSSSQDATNGSVPYYATAPAPLEQDTHNVTEPSDVTVDGSNNKVGEFRHRSPLSNHASVRAGITGPSTYTSVRFASDCLKQG